MSTTSKPNLWFRAHSAVAAVIVIVATVLLPTIAYAHPGHTHVHGFPDGFSHPFSGMDHLCAMIAIGIWAAQIGGRAFWMAPTTSIAFMALGGFLGMKTGAIPFIEQGIVTSVLMLGLLIAVTRKLPFAAVVTIIGVVAAVHGFAHGMELPRSADRFAYAIGILLSSLTLQLVAMVATALILKLNQQRIVQFGGALITVCGMVLFFQS